MLNFLETPFDNPRSADDFLEEEEAGEESDASALFYPRAHGCLLGGEMLPWKLI